MIINLKKFLSSDNLAEKFDYEMKITDIEINGVNPFNEPVKVRAEMKSFVNTSVLLDLGLAFSIRVPCDRCAEPAEHEERLSLSHILVAELGDEEDEDGVYLLIGSEDLDLDEIVHSDIVLNLPSKFLCKENCKGLCPKCGKNLNLGDCGCSSKQIDSRFEILSQLLDDNDEQD